MVVAFSSQRFATPQPTESPAIPPTDAQPSDARISTGANAGTYRKIETEHDHSVVEVSKMKDSHVGASTRANGLDASEVVMPPGARATKGEKTMRNDIEPTKDEITHG